MATIGHMSRNLGLKQAIKKQRENLKAMLRAPLDTLAREASEVWPDRKRLEPLAARGIHTIPYCKYFYAMDT